MEINNFPWNTSKPNEKKKHKLNSFDIFCFLFKKEEKIKTTEKCIHETIRRVFTKKRRRNKKNLQSVFLSFLISFYTIFYWVTNIQLHNCFVSLSENAVLWWVFENYCIRWMADSFNAIWKEEKREEIGCFCQLE